MKVKCIFLLCIGILAAYPAHAETALFSSGRGIGPYDSMTYADYRSVVDI